MMIWGSIPLNHYLEPLYIITLNPYGTLKGIHERTLKGTLGPLTLGEVKQLPTSIDRLAGVHERRLQHPKPSKIP